MALSHRREPTGAKGNAPVGRVAPGNDPDVGTSGMEDEEEDDGDFDDIDASCSNYCRFFVEIFSYDSLVYFLSWVLDIASVRVSVRFDDLLYLMAIFVLFANDIKVLSDAPLAVDPVFDVFMIIFLLFFLFEWLVNTMVKTTVYVHLSHSPRCTDWLTELFMYSRISGYMFSFPWLLDIIFIIFTCPQISWVQQTLNLQPQMLLGPTSSGITERGARLVRVIKAIQLFRVAAERRKRERQELELMDMVQYGNMDEAELMQYVKTQTLQASRESKLGNQLKESTVRRIILIVYSMVFIVPLLIYYPTDGGPYLATKVLFNLVSSPTATALSRQAAVGNYQDIIRSVYGATSLLYLDIYPNQGGNSSSTPVVRSQRVAVMRSYMQFPVEFTTYGGTGSTLVLHRVKAIIDYSEYYKRSAILTIFLYLFIGVVLAGGFWVITDDVQRLVLAPIERMMNMVDEVSRNPLQKLQFDRNTSSGGEYEMSLLESTLEKITSLLRIGFGEAGANIIKTNLNNADSSCTINPLLPGIRIYAILGFCDIHQFEYFTQQLGNDVLTFTNTIAEIVHSNVHSWRGACNKNLGNAFVLLWRIGDEDELLASYGTRQLQVKRLSSTPIDSARSWKGGQRGVQSTGGEIEVRRKKEVDLKRVPDIERWADHALISYLKIIVSINRNKRVMEYRVEPRLTMDGARDLKVRMGFGLHAGWAIEGAVGSLQKIDATYLSPHVNMAARLETSSRQYGVPLLMSQNFYELLSDEGKELCRRVDRVTVKGSEVPIDIYTYDCLQDQEFKAEKKSRGDMAAKGKGLKMLGLSGDALGGDSLHGRDSPWVGGLGPGPVHNTFGGPVIGAPAHGTDAAAAEISLENQIQGRGTRQNSARTSARDLSSAATLLPQFADVAAALGGGRAPSTKGGDSYLTREWSSSLGRSGLGLPSRTMAGSAQQRSGMANGTSLGASRRPSSVIIPINFFATESDTAVIFEKDPDLRQLRAHVTEEFRDQFETGLVHYLTGDWPLAHEELEKANTMMSLKVPALGGDGPSLALLKYMDQYDYAAPQGWMNYRPLTSK